MSLQVDTHQQRQYPIGIPIVVVLCAALAWWVITTTQSLDRQYDIINQQISDNHKPLFKVFTFGNKSTPIVLPVDDPFRPSSRWVYTSSTHPLPKSYLPTTLMDVPVPHTTSRIPFKLQADAAQALSDIFAAAASDNQPLIVVSAYRSIAEQQELYDFRVALLGKEVTEESTALPGASEHHTGLAVDINSYTPICETNSQQCGLSPATAHWLEAQAPKYGFILRFPDGKLTQTGIGYEPWHLRYIGKDALALTISGLTLDEFYQKVTTK